MRKIKIQLVLQGGGAKIVGLIAAMEAVQNQVEKKELVVTRIAGTSAGAIVAALFSAGVSMAELRRELQSGEGKKLIQHFSKPGISAITTAIVKSQPLWDVTPISDFLKKKFQEKGVSLFKDLKIPTVVIAANLSTAQKKTYLPNDSILEALMDSSGLPFCFRVWSDSGSSVIVDGGVCENLPVAELLHDKAKLGDVLAITFSTSKYSHPKGILEFGKSLLDTAIDNSVHRARALLPDSAILEIGGKDFKISTFDFNEALTTGLQGPYDKTREKADQFFHSYVTRKNQGNEITDYDPWADKSETVNRVMLAAWEACSPFTTSKLIADFVRMEVIIHGADHADETHTMIRFAPSDEPVHSVRFSVMNPVERDYLGRTAV